MPATAHSEVKTPLTAWYKICDHLASSIREESKASARLTSADSLKALIPGLTSTDIGFFMEEEAYQDIRAIVTRAGEEYFYSSQHISSTYATFLARAAGNDPVATIGETVRDESRIYPRPTGLELFLHPVFNIGPEALDGYADQVLARYSDIRKLTASTGATYLYSTTHLTEAHARSLMEWTEVEQYLNH
jgi:hypothetical protein